MANAQTIDEFIGAFEGGLRPNKFSLAHAIPPDSTLVGPYHVRAASMPPAVMTTINVPHRGRIFKMPGIKTFSTWQITVLDDKNNLHKAYHNWSNAIKENELNVHSASNDNFSSLFSTILVSQLDYNGTGFRNIEIVGAWPNNVGPIALDMENNETICTFTVDLEYQYFLYQ